MINNKKILVISDLHGKSIWKDIIDKEKNNFDISVFLGDYFDSFDISSNDQIHNYKNIIEYKEKNLENTILLIGNHDFHYLDNYEQSSGYQINHAFIIKNLLLNNKNLFKMCYKYDKYLFTHAGITKTWLKSVGYSGEDPLDLFINDIYHYTPYKFRFTSPVNKSSYSKYGDDISQTPIWVRPDSLAKDSIEGYIQVVGHTPQQKSGINFKNVNNNILLTDCFDDLKQYCIIDNGKVIIKSL